MRHPELISGLVKLRSEQGLQPLELEKTAIHPFSPCLRVLVGGGLGAGDTVSGDCALLLLIFYLSPRMETNSDVSQVDINRELGERLGKWETAELM